MRMAFAQDTTITTLAEAMVGADVFIGLSAGNVLNQDMIRSMAANPVVFAMANPTPEISYDEATAARQDIIMATGRSDYPNQVNNVLGFPFIFRGALDVRATAINGEMKIAAVRALASLAKEPVPDVVNIAYGEKNLSFGPQYIIPKPLDPRLITTVSVAVANAAIESGVAQSPITDWETYKQQLSDRLGLDNSIVRVINQKAIRDPKRVVFAEADNLKVLKAAQIANNEGYAKPILLGNIAKIKGLMAEHHIELNVPIIDPKSDDMLEKRSEYGTMLFEKRQRRGINLYEAKKLMRDRNHFGCMMVENGEADALISGLTRNYPDTIRPALQIIGMRKGVTRVSGMYIALTKKGPLFLADTTINFDPTAEELTEITLNMAKVVKKFNVTPRIALLSYSNFGSSTGESAKKVSRAVEMIHEKAPDLICDGEIQAGLAFDTEILKDNYPFSPLADGPANTLIFPNLDSGNIAYHLLKEVGQCEIIGPVLIGLNKPVHMLQLGSSVQQIVNMVSMAVVDAQLNEA